ncbi:MAG: beta-propeller domain-containing protein [Acidimicrobiia bacterium]
MRRAIVAVLGLAVLTAACTSEPITSNPTISPELRRNHPLLLFAGSGLQNFEACDDFLDYVVEHALELVTPYGLPGYYYGGPFFIADDMALPFAAVAEEAARGSAPVQGVDFSGTNVQELGVDEPDFVKTDGNRILAIAQGRLHYIDVTGSKPRLRGSLNLEQGWGQQMLLSGDRLLLMATLHSYDIYPAAEIGIAPSPYPATPITLIQEVDLSDPEGMEVVRTLRIDGAYLSARLVDDIARIVVRSVPTGLEFVYPEGGGLRAEREALEKNKEIIRNSTVENWIPYYVVDDQVTGRSFEGTLVSCESAAHPKEFSGLNMVSVITVDLERRLRPSGTAGVLADGETIYASADSLYVATTPWRPWAFLEESDARDHADSLTSQIHRFDISDPNRTLYRASGEVPGFLLSQWSMSEHEGHLRVASTNQPDWWGWGGESESFVTVLRESNGELVMVGRVGGLGKGERIYAVRFIDDVGYVVTFRQTDPLYTIDLSDPSRPTVEGELKILGYSAYLHPLGDGLLLGIGQDATEQGRVLGTQISVFDVSDLSDPDRLFKRTISDGNSEVEWDHKAFLHWGQTGLTVIPIQRYRWDEKHGEDIFLGAIGFTVDRNDGISEVGMISHEKTKGYDWGAQIRRSIVIGDVLYTVSDLGLKANDLDTLDEIDWLSYSLEG